MDISVIIISWNVEKLLKSCLASLQSQQIRKPGLGMEVLVVDNASSDGSVEMVKEEFPWVRLVENQKNVGYTAAVNQAIRLTQRPFIMLLNPDARVLGDAPAVMLEYMCRHPDMGAVGPKLLNPDGSVQSSRRRFPTLLLSFIESTVLQRFLSWLPLLRWFYFEDAPDSVVQDVDWLVGACLMLRREAVNQVGGLDESFFMYFEELDWCYRAKAAGWRITYVPKAQVLHHYGQSSAQDLLHRHIYFNESKCKFFVKHYGRVQGQILRWFILATYFMQIGEEGLKLALRHKPRLRRERLSLLWRVVETGFLRP